MWGSCLTSSRRWARENGFDTASGHQAGADKIKDLLAWCEEMGVEVVTLWLLSTDNLRRDTSEARCPPDDHRERCRRGSPRPSGGGCARSGALEALPEHTAISLRESAQATAEVTGMTVNVGVPYGGRREIADAVRAMLLEGAAAGRTVEQIADAVTAEGIAAHLYTRANRTPTWSSAPPVSAAARRLPALAERAGRAVLLRGLLAHDFRKVDFLRALRSYTTRERRFST